MKATGRSVEFDLDDDDDEEEDENIAAIAEDIENELVLQVCKFLVDSQIIPYTPIPPTSRMCGALNSVPTRASTT